jgi:hypothetical protein
VIGLRTYPKIQERWIEKFYITEIRIFVIFDPVKSTFDSFSLV